MKTIIRRYQLPLFFVLTFVISWFPWYAGIAPEVMAMGPSIAAFIIIPLVAGKAGLKFLFRSFGRVRAGAKYWLIAIFGPAVFFFLGLGGYILFKGTPPPFIMLREELSLIPLYLVLVVLLPVNGPVGEEFGWRGYALPKLQSKYGPLWASLLIGSIWGIWHLPSFFASQGVLGQLAATLGMIFIVPYTFGTIAQSIFMTWLYNKTHRSALIAGIVWHAAVNFWAPVLLSDSSLRAAQAGTHFPTIVPALYLTVLAVQVLAAILLALATRGRLGLNVGGSTEMD
jgi:uncharacterized protein